MKRGVSSDEWWPVYYVVADEDPDDGYEVEFTDAEWADYERVMAEFGAWQEWLRERHEVAYAAYLVGDAGSPP